MAGVIMLADLLQSDAILFAAAMLGIAASSLAIIRDYLPREPGSLRADRGDHAA